MRTRDAGDHKGHPYDSVLQGLAGLWLLALCTQHATPAVVDYEALEFRHGISQIPQYDLKYPHDFAHFDYVNPDAPKGGALTLACTYSMVSATPTSKPPGFLQSYDRLLERAGDELAGFYGSLAESMALSADRVSVRLASQPAHHVAVRACARFAGCPGVHQDDRMSYHER